MKRVLNKVMAFIMAAALCVGVSATAFAATTTVSTDTGTITISGVDSGLTVNAYKIAEAEYDDAGTGEFTGYKMLYTVTDGFSIDRYGNYNKETLTEANLAALYTAAQAGGVTYTATADADGTATFSNMPVGAYLFVVTGSESAVYGMIIGSVSYDVDDATGEWKIDNGSVNVKGENKWLKSTQPGITATEKGGDQEDWTHGGTADLGDVLNYEITVGPIPTYEGDYPEFYVTDTISSNLTISGEQLAALTVTIDGVTLVKDKDYTVERTESGFVVNFVVDGHYTLNAYAGQSLVIDFSATVTNAGDGTDDDVDHTNSAELTYATTSYVDENEGIDTDGDHDYTFNAVIRKVDQNGNGLAGAKFSLYTDSACETAYTQNGAAIAATSGEDGYFEYTGLEAGTYYFKETDAPTGYALNKEIYTLVIIATEEEDGTLASYSVTVYDSEGETVGDATVSGTTATITNTQLGLLPSMGSTGITLCIIAGCVVLAAAACGVIVYRRRNAA